MTENQNQIPVIWTPIGDQIVAVAPVGRSIPGWTTVFGSELGKALATLSASPGHARQQVQVRTFAMRDTDLSFWDTAVRKGSDGYSYGQVWDSRQKFLKHLQFREMAPAQGVPSAPPIDPAMLAMAAALHQIQQTLIRMEEQLESIQGVVEWLEERRKSRQAAELLTAAHTLASVGRRCLASGVVHPEDLLRVAHLEQIVGTVHREILMELQASASVLAFTQAKGARRALKVEASRISDLIRLDMFALNGLATYERLLLVSKASGQRLSAEEISESQAELTRMAKATTDAAKQLAAIKTRMEDRSIWDYMLTVGIPKGRADDAKLRKAANRARTEAQKAASKARPEVKSFIKSLESMNALALTSHAPLMLVPRENAV